MPHHDRHDQLGSKSSASAQPIHSLADLILDPTNFSALASANSPAPQEGTPPPSTQSTVSDTPSPAPGPKSERSQPSVSIADLVLNNVTYDAILASSIRGLGFGAEARELLSEDVRAPPNSPVRADVGYGSLLGVSAAIMEREN